ncbi:hypothetical protein FQN57_005347 [Myotisia sp. PD_48]|nr:hypothetical protein FQN57_005347 [Myotisia sp. PD_48]
MSLIELLHNSGVMEVLPAITSLPLGVTIPAAATALAYLNAKWSIPNDLVVFNAMSRSLLRVALATRSGQWNLFRFLEDQALNPKKANLPFLVYQGKIWSFKETYDTTLRYGNWLRNTHNVQPKEVVAIDFMNSASFVFLWLGIWSIGAIPAFINHNLTAAGLQHCIKVSTARLVIADAEIRAAFSPEVLATISAPDFREGGGSAEAIFHDEALESEILQIDPWRAPDVDRMGPIRSDPAVLIYTSGTTGLPKAAIVSWGKCLGAGTFMARWLGLKQTDRVYTCMPLYHATAAVLAFVATLVHGNSIAIGRRFSARNFWDEVRGSNSTVVQYVGETMRYLLAVPPQINPSTGKDMDKMHEVRIAYGNGLRPDVWNKVKDRFGIRTIGEIYSATESTSGSWNLSSNDFSAGAIGRTGAIASALIGRGAVIVKLDHVTEAPWRDPVTGFCKKLPRGDLGELLYKVDENNIGLQFQGYFNNEKANNSKIMRGVFKKGDAWFRTGDVIRWDPEGRWYFSDRIGDTFRWRGENVSTHEVSEIFGSHPEVYETNVYGVQLPHHDGRAGCAALVLKGSQSGDPEADALLPPIEPSASVLASIAEHASKNLPKYAVPLFLRVTRVLETTGNNKQQKTTLRSEGVDPNVLEAKNKTDLLYWLRGGTYVPFKQAEWGQVNAGLVRL